MIRARFKAAEDSRPVNWPVEHPFWCTGEGDDCFVMIAYANDELEILQNWPDAFDIETKQVSEYEFSDRFPKPDWFED